MIIDAQNMFSNAQAITAAAGSTNTIDLKAVRDIGTGQPLYIALLVTTTLDDTGDNSTLAVALEGDSTESFTPDATRTLVTLAANTAAGSQYFFPLQPNGGPEQLRYIRLSYTPANGDLSAGAVSAWLTHEAPVSKAYADAITIS